MVKGEGDTLVRHMQTLFEVGASGNLTDRQLLERYRSGKGEAAGLAFAALVDRHGPMVLRACRAVLRDHHEACDAFQATFLVLIRRAPTLWVRESLGAWLHQVAHRTASCARADAARRRRHEQRAAELAAIPGRAGDDELGAVLHEEIARLPDRYRSAVVLCLLEGLTREQAARRLGCPTGTVESRLARGREQLRLRLARRGIATAGAALAAVSTAEGASIPLPAGIAESITQAAMRFAASGDTVGATSAAVAALADGMLRTMFMTKLKTMVVALALIGGVVAGAGALGQQSGRNEPLVPGQPSGNLARPKDVPPVPVDNVLKIPGPARGERMEIIIDRGETSERLVLEDQGRGAFLVTHDVRGANKRREPEEIVCSTIEITAPRVPVPGQIVSNHPLPPGTVVRSVPAPDDRDHERRLSRMEQKLEQILNALESRENRVSPAGRDFQTK